MTKDFFAEQKMNLAINCCHGTSNELLLSKRTLKHRNFSTIKTIFKTKKEIINEKQNENCTSIFGPMK